MQPKSFVVTTPYAQPLGSSQSYYRDRSQISKGYLHLLLTREPYHESVFVRIETAYRKRTENRFKAQARALGYQLVPAAS